MGPASAEQILVPHSQIAAAVWSNAKLCVGERKGLAEIGGPQAARRRTGAAGPRRLIAARCLSSSAQTGGLSQ